MHHADTNTTPDPPSTPATPLSPPLPRLASPDPPTPTTTQALHSLDVPDLRRRDARLCTEQITRRAAFLRRDDRTLVLAVYDQGRSFADLSALSGVPIRLLRGRLRRILQRMTRPEFAFVALHLEGGSGGSGGSWPLTMRRVGECCVLHGEPVRRAAQTLRLSYYTVRKYRVMILALAGASIVPSTHRGRSLAG